MLQIGDFFMISKCLKDFCRNPELVENYDLAIADTENVWICHHRLEEFYTRKELIAMKKYFGRPAEEIVLCKNQKEHFKYPHKGHENQVNTRRRKRVLCVETSIIYESALEAERKTGIPHNNISNVCNGKKKFKTAGGYHWSFV